MNSLILTVFLCAILGIFTIYSVNGQDRYYYDEDDDRINVDRRRPRGLCIPYMSPCTTDTALRAKYDFLECCNNGACKCTIWGNNCRCQATLRG